MANKKIIFSVPDWLYKGLQDLPFMSGNIRVEDLFKACAINRMIQRGYLDEFGCPIELPKINFECLPEFTEDDKKKALSALGNIKRADCSFNEYIKKFQ